MTQARNCRAVICCNKGFTDSIISIYFVFVVLCLNHKI